MNGPQGILLKMETTRFEKSLFQYKEEPKPYILEAARVVLISSIPSAKCQGEVKIHFSASLLLVQVNTEVLFLNTYSTTL